MQQYHVIGLFLLAIFWSGFFLFDSAVLLWSGIFNDCKNGFPYNAETKECSCQSPFSGTLCEENLCLHGSPTLTSYGYKCECEGVWSGTLCDICGAYDHDGGCLGSIPYPNGNKCREEVLENYQISFLGADCDLICVQSENYRTLQGPALERYNFYLEKSPENTLACPGVSCYGCSTETREALCVDGSLKTYKECDVSCGPCTNTFCKPCNRRGICQLQGDVPVCQCDSFTRGAECEVLCPGVTEVFNGISTTLNGPECNSNGQCNDAGVCDCLEDSLGNPLFLGEACSLECPADSSGTVCSGHGQCVVSGTNAVCQCDNGWVNNVCGCSDGTTATKTCLHGQCIETVSGCSCDDDEILGHWAGPFCTVCSENWFSPSSFCLQFCDPEVTCNGNAAFCRAGATVLTEEGLTEACTVVEGEDGTLSLEGTCATCECNPTFNSSILRPTDAQSLFQQCAQCVDDYYPQVGTTAEPAGTEFCSVQCDSNKCHNRGACLKNSGGCVCHGNCPSDAGNVDGQCLTLGGSLTIQPQFLESENCAICEEHFGPDIKGEAFWQSSCKTYCNPLATESDSFPSICYDQDGLIREECVFCSGRADNCSFVDTLPTCNCQNGYAGDYCQASCGAEGAASCSGTGTCVTDNLANWLDIATPAYQRNKDPANGYAGSWKCACDPQDITVDERDAYEEAFYLLTKYGLPLEQTQESLPPRPEYFGLGCSASCPQVDGKACDGRGYCRSYETGLSTEYCTVDADCNTLGNSAEDGDRYCYYEQKPRFWEYVSKLPASTLSACSSSEVEYLQSFLSTYDWNNFCYKYVSHTVPEQTHSSHCKDCDALVDPGLWETIDEKCERLVEYSNFETLQTLTKDCTSECTISVANFDWNNWCSFGSSQISETCPATCSAEFKAVDWISNTGFCHTYKGFLENHYLVGLACAPFRNEDVTRGRDFDSCEQITEGRNEEYEISSSCFVPRETTKNEFGATLVQPFSGTNNQIQCRGVGQGFPEVCGSVTHRITYNASLSTTEEYQYCNALYPNGWSTFSLNQYIVETNIMNHSQDEYTNGQQIAVLVSNVEEVLGQELKDAALVYYRGKDGIQHEGILIGECTLQAPKCMSCGAGDSLRNGTGAIILESDNPDPKQCCSKNMYFQKSSTEESRFWCHSLDSIGVNNCRYKQCAESIHAYDWKSELNRMDRLNGLDGANIPELERPSIRRSFSLEPYCSGRKTLDDAVRQDASGVNAFYEYCTFVDAEKLVYGIRPAAETLFYDGTIDTVPEVVKLNIAKTQWWDTIGVPDVLASYDESFWYKGNPAAKRVTETVQPYEFVGSNPMAVSFWLYFEPSPYKQLFRAHLGDSQGSLRWLQSTSTTAATGALLQLEIRLNTIYINNVPLDFDLEEDPQWYHVVFNFDWAQKLIDIEIADTFVRTDIDMLCKQEPSTCHVFETEEAYTNFLQSIYAEKYSTAAGVYDSAYTQANDTLSLKECADQAQVYFAHSSSTGVCMLYNLQAGDLNASNFVSTSQSDPALFVYKQNNILGTSVSLSVASFASPESQVFLHDFRVVPTDGSIVGSYMDYALNGAGRSTLLSADDCASFLAPPTDIPILNTFPSDVLNKRRWGRICEDLTSLLQLPDTFSASVCGNSEECVQAIALFVDNEAADWYYQFASESRPNATKTQNCQSTVACDVVLETFDYEEACDASLREVFETCDECEETFTNWRNGNTVPAFNKTEFCTNMDIANDDIKNTFEAAIAGCSGTCKTRSEEVNYLEFCNTRLATHDPFAPHVLSYNLSAYCRRQVFSSLKDELRGTEHALNYSSDCKALGERGSTKIVNNKPGVCHRSVCECTEYGIGGDRCNIQCIVGSLEPESPCNEALGLGTCCLAPDEGVELNFLNCATDYNPPTGTYAVGECLCNNKGTSALISGVNCDTQCAQCGEEFGSCVGSGTCMCKNSEYMETIESHYSVEQNRTYSAIDETGVESTLLFDWANAETAEGNIEGDTRTQVPMVLLFDVSLKTGCDDGLDQCCDWTEQSSKNPLDPAYEYNRLVTMPNTTQTDMQCSLNDSYEKCIYLCTEQSTCSTVEYNGEVTQIQNKRKGWPLKGQVMLSEFALAQEPLNYLPQTNTIDGLVDGMCRSYTLQRGRYRVLFQNGLYNQGPSCSVGTGTSALLDTATNRQEAYTKCQSRRDCRGFVVESDGVIHLFSGATEAGCSLETHARPTLTPRPVTTGKRVLYRNNWCTVETFFDIAGNKIEANDQNLAFGLVGSIDCDEVIEQHSFDFERCQFPFYLPVFDSNRQEFLLQKMTECTDLNIGDGYLGQTPERDINGLARSSTLVDFNSLKEEITAITGIPNPKYCVSEQYLRNISEHIEREEQGMPFSMCRKNTFKRSRCTRNVADTDNCRCGEATCNVDEYCYEKVFGGGSSTFECHKCGDLLSPAPEQCCDVGESLQFLKNPPTCIAKDDVDFGSYCNYTWGCPRNWGSSTATGDKYVYSGKEYNKGEGPHPELFCDNTCYNYATKTCGCDQCDIFPSPLEVLRLSNGGSKIGGLHSATYENGELQFRSDGEIPIPFVRICKDPLVGAINNSQYAFNIEEEKDYRDAEFIRKNKATENNPSSRCGSRCSEVCPGTDPHTNVPCSGRGQCLNDCQCSCFSLDTISDRTFFLTELRGGGLGALPDYSISSLKSPYRGVACENVCPGFDERFARMDLSDNDKLYIMNELVCSGHGSCLLNQQGVTQCSCENSFKSGSQGSCEFFCPTSEGSVCSGHGDCSVEPVGTSRAFVDGLVRIYADLIEAEDITKLTVKDHEQDTKRIDILMHSEKVIHTGSEIRFTGFSALPSVYKVAKVVSTREFFFYATGVTLANGDYFDDLGTLQDEEFLKYNPEVLEQTVSYRMTSFVYDTNTLESAYNPTNSRFYISPDAREAVDSMIPQVKFLSICPEDYPYPYHHGLYCCSFEKSANSSILRGHSAITECPRAQRRQCPTIEYYEQERGLLERFGTDSRYINKDGKTSLSFFCRKTVLNSEEEQLCKIERKLLEENVFSTNPFEYTCDTSTEMVRMLRDTRPYYDEWAILELGAGSTDQLLYTYEDVHCKNVIPAELNSNGLSLGEQPQPITLLECATCKCKASASSGFFAGTTCSDCAFGFSGNSCKDTCPGICGQIAVGSQLIYYEEYQNKLGITQPCDNPQRDGFFYSCPTKEELKEITVASGKVWDEGSGEGDSGYERSIFCQDGRNSAASCIRCPTPLIGNIDINFEEAPERSCNRLSCPRLDGKLKSINLLKDTEFSIDLSLSMWHSNFVFTLYGADPDVVYEAKNDRTLSRSLPIDLFEPCPTGYEDVDQNECCKDTETCKKLNLPTLTLNKKLALHHRVESKSPTECAILALSTDKYPIYVGDQIHSYSPYSYFQASKGFFSTIGGSCYVYKGFEGYQLDYFHRAPNDNARITGLTAFTSQTITDITAVNYRASYTCSDDCPEKPLSKRLSRWAGSTTEEDHSTAVTTTYELACMYNNDYASILPEAQDDKQDGLLQQTVDPYSDAASVSVVDLVAVIQKDRCLLRFFQLCRQGHALEFQNPFLTWYSFSKMEEYLNAEYPEGTDQTNRCNMDHLKNKLWCPQCPRCVYSGEIPGHDLELDTTKECELGYFPYCKSAASGCGSTSWFTNPSCALPSFAPNYNLVDSLRQTVDISNSTKVSIGKETLALCALKTMPLTVGGYFFYNDCEVEACECYYYTEIKEPIEIALSNDGFLYSIDFSSTYSEINVFERYIQQFVTDSPLSSWWVERMRQAIPDKYRSFTVETNTSVSNFMEEYRQWLECSCVVATGNEEGRDFCDSFDVSRCVHFNPVQIEWELLWYDQGIRSENIYPNKETGGALHDPKGSGAVLRTGGRLKSDVERIVVAVPETCTEVLPDPTSPDYENTQFIASQIECGKSGEIHCTPPANNRTEGSFDFNPGLVRDSNGKTVAHYRCKEKVATAVSIDECANEAQKRFSVYNGSLWLSRGYFAVERPQLNAALFSSHKDYEIYDFDTSSELTCYVYKNVDASVVKSPTWNSLAESFCEPTLERKNDYGCPRAATLFSSVDDNCTDCDPNLPELGGDCEEPVFVKSYYIPNLSDAGGFPQFTLTPLEEGALTCFKYGPCFTDTKVWTGCRPTMLTGEVSSLHYPYYSETPLHDMTDSQKTALGISTVPNYLENMLFDASFGFYTEVRDSPDGSSYNNWQEDWLNMCYDDMSLSDKEKVVLANRELYRANDYTQYNLLYMDLVCPAFAEKFKAYHAKTRGRYAASAWAKGDRKNADNEVMQGSGHTKLFRIRVDEKQANYIHSALVILDNRTIIGEKVTIGDPAYPTYATDGISYEQFIKPYCDSGVQPEKPYGNCLKLESAAIKGRIYWKEMEMPSGEQEKVSHYRIKEFPTKNEAVAGVDYAVEGDVYIEHDSVILLFLENGKYVPIQSFEPLDEYTLAVEKFEIYKNTGRIETTTAKPMHETLYRDTQTGLSMFGQACAPMSQDLSNLTSKLKASDYNGTAAAMSMRFFRPQTLDVIKKLSNDHRMGFGPSCGCKRGFSNVRYSDYNQPFDLNSGCSAPENDVYGTFIDYKPCFGMGSCAQYPSTPFCAGFDKESTIYDKVCINAEGKPEVEACNRPWGGCKYGQRGALNIDSLEVECKAATDPQENHASMTAAWVSPHSENFIIDPHAPRTQYNGDDDSKGVVYVNNKPKDQAKSNFNFVSVGCHACTNGRKQNVAGSVECDACEQGTYNIDYNNPWRLPPTMNENGVLPINRWKDQSKPTFEYEWWKIAGFPAEIDQWHEVNDWAVLAPLTAYYMDSTGHWRYDSQRSLKPQRDPGWAPPKKGENTECNLCPDNFASIPYSLECTVDGKSIGDCPVNKLLHQVGDKREGYNYPAMGNRLLEGNRNCLACPPGYDTGLVSHLEAGDTPATNGLQECPITYPYAFSTKQFAPYYGSHCCKENIDPDGDRFSYGLFYDSPETACTAGTCILAKQNSVCMLATYGNNTGESLLTRRSIQENNIEYCNAAARRMCETGGHAYELRDSSADQCMCKDPINNTETPVNTNTFTCFDKRLWDFIGQCEYTLYIGKRHIFDIQNLQRTKDYTLHLTALHRAAAQYSVEAEALWDVNPTGVIESTPVTHVLNRTLPYKEQCEALASAEPEVQRFSVNTETGLCLLVYYVEDIQEQRLRQETQVCNAAEHWESYDLKLSKEDTGRKNVYSFDRQTCDAYEYNTVELRQEWVDSVDYVDDSNFQELYFSEKQPYGASVERIENATVFFTFSEAAEECFQHKNCVGVGTESTDNIVQFYFPAKHNGTLFDNVIRHQYEQSPFYYRKKYVKEQNFKTVGYYFECNSFADVNAPTATTSFPLNCSFDPFLCYTQCRERAEAEGAKAFTFPSFPLGEGMAEGSLCSLYDDEGIQFKDIGVEADFAGAKEYIQKSACIRNTNDFGGGFVPCNANYDDSSALQASNGFYCADFDYKMYDKDYAGGHDSVEGLTSLHKTCLVEELNTDGICQVTSDLGTCTSYNVEGVCKTREYVGKNKKLNPMTTLVEQDQRGICVQRNLEGVCEEDSTLGTCTEAPVVRKQNLYENPLGHCTDQDGNIKITSLAECENMDSYEPYLDKLTGNHNFRPMFHGPKQRVHTNELEPVKYLQALTEDIIYFCENACYAAHNCLAFRVDNSPVADKEKAPFHTPRVRNCTLYGEVAIQFNASINSNVNMFQGPGMVWFYRSRVYSGRAKISDDFKLEVIQTIHDKEGKECMLECNKESSCVAYAYNATKHCELIGQRPNRTDVYKKEGLIAPAILSRHTQSYGDFDSAYYHCERSFIAINPYRSTLDQQGKHNLCQGIVEEAGQFYLIQNIYFGNRSTIALGSTLPADCSVEHTGINSIETCESLTIEVPYQLGYPEEAQRYNNVTLFSFNPHSSTCIVIRPGYGLNTCPLQESIGHTAYQLLPDENVRMAEHGNTAYYTNQRDDGSLSVSINKHALFTAGHHGVEGGCLDHTGKFETPMECVGSAIDAPIKRVIQNYSLVAAETDGVCEQNNDRGTMENKNTIGFCQGVNEYGLCISETQRGTCTKMPSLGTCLEYSTCNNTLIGTSKKGRCFYSNTFGQCKYEIEEVECKKEPLLGECLYTSKAGECQYYRYDGQATFRKTNYELSAYLQNDNETVNLLTQSSSTTKDGFARNQLPVVPFSPLFTSRNVLYRGEGNATTLEELKDLCIASKTCRGISPGKGSFGRANGRDMNGRLFDDDAIVGNYPTSMEISRRSIEMENERDFNPSFTLAVDSQNNTLRLSLNGSLAPDDECELECQKAAMLAFNGTNATRQWMYQVDDSGTCLCSASPSVRCPHGGFLRLLTRRIPETSSKQVHLFNFRNSRSQFSGDVSVWSTKMFYEPPMSIASLTEDPAELICESCPAGTYDTGDETCSFCPDGYYNDQVGQTSCSKKCPVGRFYSDANRQADSANWWQAECTGCAKGQYQDEEGSSTSCKTCAAGRYQDTIGSVNCKGCVAGMATTSTGGDDMYSCDLCGKGYYTPYAGYTVCLACSGQSYTSPSVYVSGKYTQYEGRTYCQTCSYLTTAYNDAAQSCESCRVGQYAPGPSGLCTGCPVGKFQDSTGQSSCKDCPAGQYQDTTGKTACKTCSAGSITGRTGTGAPTCTTCAAGKYSTASNVASCTNCAAGQYQDTTGKNTCKNCVVGKYSVQTGQAGCTICPFANYQDQTGKTSCNECPAGRWAWRDVQAGPEGYDSLGDCILCLAGRYSSQTALYYNYFDNKCTACAAGKYASSGSSSCTSCVAGKYASSGSSSCTNCAAGKYTLKAGAASSSACLNCGSGQYQNEEGKAPCKVCAAGRIQAATGQTSCNGWCNPNSKLYSTAGSSACSTCTRCQRTDSNSNGEGISCTNMERYGSSGEFNYHPGYVLGTKVHYHYMGSSQSALTCFRRCRDYALATATRFWVSPSGWCDCWSSGSAKMGTGVTFRMDIGYCARL
jgi:hypothetical protein